MWYELAIGENAYTGNEAKIVQGRIDETKSYGGSAMQDKATLAKQVKELKPIVLPLKGKTVVEFVGVPAGEFTMGTDDPKCAHFCQSLMKPHEVIITRPFWLSKYKVTKEVWSSYRKTILSDYDKVLGGMSVPQIVSYNEAMEFCEWLTKRVRSKLPNGYIVRLPTEAEWEYALFVRDTDADSLYRNWNDNVSQISYTKRDIQKLYESKGIDTSNLAEDWQMTPIEVGKKKPNGLGLYDMLANGKDVMLDTFDDSTFESKTWLEDKKKNANQTGIIYANKEIDPLRYYYGKVGARCISRGGGWWFPHPFVKRGEELKGVFLTLRLCIGPDLMKEKGYKFKLQKKR
jgi:formylglycine-generating enzyme required for sulfatase activity